MDEGNGFCFFFITSKNVTIDNNEKKTLTLLWLKVAMLIFLMNYSQCIPCLKNSPGTHQGEAH